MHVLIVDDYRSMIRIIRGLLVKLGFEHIDEASDGQTALKKISENTVDLVISDWNMKPMSGSELLEKARLLKNKESIPFLMVTAQHSPREFIGVPSMGCDQFIVKPFNAETLSKKIQNIIPNPLLKHSS